MATFDLNDFIESEVKDLLLNYASIIKEYIDSKNSEASIEELRNEIIEKLNFLGDIDRLEKSLAILDSLLKALDTDNDNSISPEEIEEFFNKVKKDSQAIKELLKKLTAIQSQKDALLDYLNSKLSELESYKDVLLDSKKALEDSLNSMLDNFAKLADIDYIRVSTQVNKEIIINSVSAVFFHTLYKDKELLELTTYPPGYAVIRKHKDFEEILTTAVSGDQKTHGHFFEVHIPYNSFKYVRFSLQNHASGVYTKNIIQAKDALDNVLYQVTTAGAGVKCEIPGGRWIDVYFPVVDKLSKFKFIEACSAGIGVREMEFVNYVPKDAKYVVKPTTLCTEWYV